MKKRNPLGDVGSDQPIFSLLGAEDLLPRAGKPGRQFPKLKQEIAEKYDFSLSDFQQSVYRYRKMRKKKMRLYVQE
ncbi:hypothetical protein SDC9_13616 [bioreactor metagenome]|uniref:Uncharacterized protein n=1 Tax=bioreactor metagenome TaxID=1076179 RepID=A0A644TLU5_9ZZZZ|nr:hypothetical protein [Negativicutes bacterium]